MLRWTAAPKAAYYNVQLFRGGHKVLTTWTSKPQLRLPRQWQLDGKGRAADARAAIAGTSGPGTASRQPRRYGKLLGSSSFVVR